MNWINQFDEKLITIINNVEEKITQKRKEIQEVALFNQQKVLRAFQQERVAATDLLASTGYGYDDIGREKLDKIYARSFGAESAIVRPQIVSGTHALATALFGLLKPTDELLYITGTPYDTLLEVIGVTGDGRGSLKEIGVGFDFVPLKDGKVNFEQVKEQITPKTKVVAIQRSRGYAGRASFTIEEIKEMCDFIRSFNKEVIIFADNCYGEFSETIEPTEVGVDLMAGSLIKNPGGGIAKTGGYIAGKTELVEAASYRLTTAGVGSAGGAMGSNTYDFLQGFFLSPHTVSQAIQGAIFTAALLEEFGVEANPKWHEKRTDLIQTIELGTVEAMTIFCQTVQKLSPIDSNILPIPSAMPGYEDEILMAAGSFVEGSTMEFSCDGPVRPPYRVFLQGGLTYEHVKLAVAQAVSEIYFKG
ncbi:Cystathionine beta-lyase family protein involved in aluminum resistance [Pilibacter termitis]|uniref:Cystathionine beta-lyase family protein involved in aluminum resistance n=1 Tax=Pilibacter termitis TaxID=263852 RepID=A0A1T4N8V1_9ENTE|nr:aminotransferase class V-fold PLP-dependent enzyme [Pilibacter termitis]SJZ75659.1 Cystathionine beta-lyase family protein involved in aluminum resistance [Pilibacter termitis]